MLVILEILEILECRFFTTKKVVILRIYYGIGRAGGTALIFILKIYKRIKKNDSGILHDEMSLFTSPCSVPFLGNTLDE